MQYTKIMPYTQQQMRDLVLDVQSYALFVPNIKTSVVTSIAGNTFQAELQLKSPALSYISVVTYSEDCIRAASTTFPLKYLQADWFFKKTALYECEVNFNLKMHLIGPIMTFGLRSFAKNIMNAFEKEAYRRYGL